MEYIFILLFILLVTFILEKRYRLHLYHNRRERFTIVFLFFVIGVLWDSVAFYRSDWIIPKNKMMGLIIGDLPLEEYLFILIIPYSILTIYKIFDAKLGKQKVKRKKYYH